MELRKSGRFVLRLAVIYGWSEGKSARRYKGVTRDISSCGLFIISNIPPPTDAIVNIEVMIPPRTSGDASLQLRAKGHVVRVTDAPDVPGFAIAADIKIKNPYVM